MGNNLSRKFVDTNSCQNFCVAVYDTCQMFVPIHGPVTDAYHTGWSMPKYRIVDHIEYVIAICQIMVVSFAGCQHVRGVYGADKEGQQNLITRDVG